MTRAATIKRCNYQLSFVKNQKGLNDERRGAVDKMQSKQQIRESTVITLAV